MASPSDDKSEKTKLDHVRPTVVVRRRVYEPSPASTRKVIHAGALPVGSANGSALDIDEDEESGPPSSVNVARALSSLRAHELKRLDALMSADDDDGAPVSRGPRSMRSSALVAAAAPAAAPIAPPIAPKVRVGSSIAIAELARQMEMQTQELVTTLVMRGFFSVTVKSALPRETARTAATMFGFQVEEVADDEPASKKTKVKAAASSSPALPSASAKKMSGKAAAAPSRANAKPAAKKNTCPRAR